MKNFLRGIRYSLAYRNRIALSILFALLAAACWSLNFTAIYPVLKILGTEQTLQQWVDQRIEECQTQIDASTAGLDRARRQYKALEAWPAGRVRDDAEHKMIADIAKHESKLDDLSTRMLRYQQLKKYFINRLPNDRFQTLAVILGLVIAAIALKGVFEFGQESLVGSIVNGTLYDLRNRFFRNVIHLDVRQVGDHGTHELMARFTNDMEMFGTGLKMLYGRIVAEPLRALGCIVVACFISWQLTLMFVVLVPAALYILTKASRMMKRASRRMLERMSSIYQILQETLQGVRVVKAFTTESYERRRFRAATRDFYHRAMQMVNIDALAGPIIEVLGVVAVASALLAGAYLVLTGETHLFGMRMTDQKLEFETLLQLYLLLAAIADPVRKLSSVYTKLQSGAAAADRIFNHLDLKPQVRTNPTGSRLAPHHESIEFRDVCFSYEPGSPVLNQVNLKVKFGETIALVGKNGCGKSTLMSLLPRFLDPDYGWVLIDGVDIRKAHLRTLRKQIGLVTQDTTLFDDTIAANIAYGTRHTTPEQIEAAAKTARAHDFVTRLPKGYDTRVGEASFTKVSGGQKQRLALARAILRDPRILILDEFTSAADPEDEALVHEALREFKRGRTTFVITHRLNTLEIADRIVVLDAGKVTAVGTHVELLAGCPLYQRLHEAYFQLKAA